MVPVVPFFIIIEILIIVNIIIEILIIVIIIIEILIIVIIIIEILIIVIIILSTSCKFPYSYSYFLIKVATN